jgi:hypothetical protein
MTALAQLARDVCAQLDATGTPTAAFAAALATEDRARKRKAKFLATHAECLRQGLEDHSLPLTRVGLFGAVSVCAALSPEAVERHYYGAVAEYGAPSLLAARLNPEN